MECGPQNVNDGSPILHRSAIGNDVVNGLNAVDKRYIYQSMSTVKLTGSNLFDSLMQIHTGNQKDDVSLANKF